MTSFEHWRPVETEARVGVAVSPHDHLVQVDRETYWVSLVVVRFCRTDHLPWETLRVSVVVASRPNGHPGKVWRLHELDETPDWLAAIIARAAPEGES